MLYCESALINCVLGANLRTDFFSVASLNATLCGRTVGFRVGACLGERRRKQLVRPSAIGDKERAAVFRRGIIRLRWRAAIHCRLVISLR